MLCVMAKLVEGDVAVMVISAAQDNIMQWLVHKTMCGGARDNIVTVHKTISGGAGKYTRQLCGVWCTRSRCVCSSCAVL